MTLKDAVGGGNPIFIFLDLVELDSQCAEGIEAGILKTLEDSGFPETYLQANWIAFACDGASVMLGTQTGVATRLAGKFPRLFIWHCLNHRLELTVADSVKGINPINHLQAFIDKLYTLYNQSSKNCRELREVAAELDSRVLKIGRILDVRWVASSLRTVKAVWDSYEALHRHYEASAVEANRDGYTRRKYKGLALRLETTNILLDLGLLYDSL